MALLTPEDRAFIDSNPLSGSHSLSDPNRLSAEADTFLSDTFWCDLDPQDDCGVNARDAVSNLLVGLLVHPVAGRLRSTYRSVCSELVLINAKLLSNDFDYEIHLGPFTPLAEVIAEKGSDVEIWQAVLEFILAFAEALFLDSVQKRTELEEPMRHELDSRTYIDVQGFFTKCFENQSWSEKFENLLTKVKKDAALHSFPNKEQPEETEVWEWLDKFQKKYLTQAQGMYYPKSKAAITHAQDHRQLIIFLKDRNAPVEEPHSARSARDARVIGVLTKSPREDTWTKKYLQLATYVRDVFARQLTRWFVHGFLIFGSQIELWVFDRSGAYSSDTFDVREHPERFIRIIAGYAMMGDSELGLSPVIQYYKSGASVTVTDVVTREDVELQLQLRPGPIVSHPAIVSRGTTCFFTHNGTEVIKMSWRPDKQPSEIDLLVAAQGVRGTPRLIGSRDFTSIGELRSGLVITMNDSATRPARLNVSDSERGWTSSRTPHHDRIFTCLAIAPAGRPLEEFNSVLEVLQAFQDTIKAHQSLFLERNILHRDISINNIILTDPEQNNGCTGMLIDFDLAVLIGKNETGERNIMTGTLQFMAIQVLENSGFRHTYRHDLESFFYVLLYLCIMYGWPPGHKATSEILKSWYQGEIEQIYVTKCGQMTKRVFELVLLQEFSPDFELLKPLARKLRDILFTTGAVYVETPEDPSTLYNPFIQAFEDAIREVKW